MKKFLYLLIAIFLIAQPMSVLAQDLSPLPVPEAQNAQNMELQPISPNDAAKNQAEVVQEESVSTKPASADIEKNSIQEPYDSAGKSDLQLEVVPETKSELTKAALKFLHVMFAVLISSVILYFLLLFVKKFYYTQLEKSGKSGKRGTEDQEDDLSSPETESEALKMFLNQTKNY